jgi:hypothetical protein
VHEFVTAPIIPSPPELQVIPDLEASRVQGRPASLPGPNIIAGGEGPPSPCQNNRPDFRISIGSVECSAKLPNYLVTYGIKDFWPMQGDPCNSAPFFIQNRLKRHDSLSIDSFIIHLIAGKLSGYSEVCITKVVAA